MDDQTPSRPVQLRMLLARWYNVIAPVVSLIVLGGFLYLFQGRVQHVLDNREAVIASLESTRTYVESYGWLSSVAFIAVYALGNAVWIPQFVLGLTGGLIFGVPTGILLVLLGVCGSSMIYYILGRVLGTRLLNWFGRVEMTLFRNHLEDIDTVTLLQLRMNSFVPFHALSGACGIYGVSLSSYLVSTISGLIPRVVVYVFLGTSITPDNPHLVLAVTLWIMVGIFQVFFGLWHSHTILKRQPEVPDD